MKNLVVPVLVFALSAWASPSAAQSSTNGFKNVPTLGGARSFTKTQLTTATSLKRMVDAKGIAADVRTVLADSGLSATSDAVIAFLSGVTSSVAGGSCSDALPADGVLVECDVQPGATLEWMAHRPNIGSGDRTPGRIEHVRWAGAKPFKAFLFRVTSNGHIYTFVVPKICGNVSLMSQQPVSARGPLPPLPAIAALAVAAAPPPPSPPLPPVAPPTLPEPPPATAPAFVSSSIAMAPEAAAPPPQVAPARAIHFFIDALAGKDRRVRPIAGSFNGNGEATQANSGPLDFAQCSPLFGVKVGVAKRFQSDWEIAAAGGVAFSLVRNDNKVREHQVLVDIEANRYLTMGAFVGAGLSLWDLTHSDSFSPALMGHVGVPLVKGLAHPVYFLFEGRLFLKKFNDVSNNYQFWAGVRIGL